MSSSSSLGGSASTCGLVASRRTSVTMQKKRLFSPSITTNLPARISSTEYHSSSFISKPATNDPLTTTPTRRLSSCITLALCLSVQLEDQKSEDGLTPIR